MNALEMQHQQSLAEREAAHQRLTAQLDRLHATTETRLARLLARGDLAGFDLAYKEAVAASEKRRAEFGRT
jgi:hypothetical protein